MITSFVNVYLFKCVILVYKMQVKNNVCAYLYRMRMRLRRRLATLDDIVAELEDDFIPKDDSDDE